jgi:ParD-like antitoxin of type II bacterial toxin-antitoxin system
MSQPVKLSDSLVLEARLAGEIVERSIAGQVEFWARLGRSVDQLLDGRSVLALCRNAEARPLSECLESVDSPAGRERVAGFLKRQPFPHYEAHPTRPGVLVRIGADGERTAGRFVNRQFRPSAANPSRKAKPFVKSKRP